MGQAKQRGTREERIVQSIKATHRKKEKAKKAADVWWESLTEEEQQAELGIEEVPRGKAYAGGHTHDTFSM